MVAWACSETSKGNGCEGGIGASAVCTAVQRKGHLEHWGSGPPRWRCLAAAARSAPALQPGNAGPASVSGAASVMGAAAARSE